MIYASGDIAGDYLVEVTGQADATGTVDAANDRTNETYPGLADGTYTVTVTNVTTATQVGSLDVTFICDGVPGTIDAAASVACVNGGEDGEITVETETAWFVT